MNRRDSCHYESNGVSRCFLLIWVSMTPQEDRGREGKRNGKDVSKGNGKEKINGVFNCIVQINTLLLWQKKRDK